MHEKNTIGQFLCIPGRVVSTPSTFTQDSSHHDNISISKVEWFKDGSWLPPSAQLKSTIQCGNVAGRGLYAGGLCGDHPVRWAPGCSIATWRIQIWIESALPITYILLTLLEVAFVAATCSTLANQYSPRQMILWCGYHSPTTWRSLVGLSY